MWCIDLYIKKSKFLFYHFNSYLHLENRPDQLIRHSTISDDTFVLNTLQNKNWLYFIEKIIDFSQSSLDLNSFSISDREEADIILNTKESLKFLKDVYQNFYGSVGHFLYDYLYNLPILEQDAIEKDLRLKEYKFFDFNSNYNDREMINTYDSFYYHFGRFPGNYNIL